MEFLKTQGNFIQYGPNAICYRGRSMKNRIQTLMNVSRILVTLVAMVGVASNVVGADSPTLDPHLEVLRPLLEKTWKQVSEAKPGSTNKPALDVARWERALNGKAVRILHSINDGVYGGESIVMWDAAKQAVTYHYFTTATFTTEGTMTFKDGKIITHEIVSGNAGGITEVRGEFEIRSDGTYHVKAEHLKDGTWSPGREATYREDATAKVVFK